MQQKIACILLFFMLTVVACDSHKNQYENIHHQIVLIKNRKIPELKNEPLPTMPSTKNTIYQTTSVNDPFTPSTRDTVKSKNKVFGSQKKQPLEVYALDSLQMVGTIIKNKKIWAIILAPNNKIYSISIGEHIGKNHGVITFVSTRKIKINERVFVKNDRKNREIQLFVKESKE